MTGPTIIQGATGPITAQTPVRPTVIIPQVKATLWPPLLLIAPQTSSVTAFVVQTVRPVVGPTTTTPHQIPTLEMGPKTTMTLHTRVRLGTTPSKNLVGIKMLGTTFQTNGKRSTFVVAGLGVLGPVNARQRLGTATL